MTGIVRKTSWLIVLSTLLLAASGDIAEAKSKRKILREFKGWYTGRCGGAIGLTTGVLQEVTPVNTSARFFLGGPNVSTIQSPSGRIYQLTTRHTRIRSKKVVVKARYSGDFVNPNTALPEAVGGARNVTINKKRKRFVMRINDNLVEGTLSYWNLRCGATKKRRR